MVKRGIIIFLAILLLFPIVSAMDTPIKIITIPDHKVSVFVYPAGEMMMIESYFLTSDSSGVVELVHTSSKNKIDVLVKVTENGNKIFLEKFEGYEAGEQITIRVDNAIVDGSYDETPAVENKTEVVEENTTTEVPAQGEFEANTTEVTQETKPETGNAPTGAVVSDGSSGGKGWLLYIIIIAVIIVGGVVFLVGKNYAANSANKKAGIEFVKKSPPSAPVVQTPGQGQTTLAGSDIQRLESKIRDAQKELNLLKNQERIKSAEARLEADRKELDRLRSGE